ncbi:MAG: two-component regulator propeller domain-containing protein, partial [Chitinophagaceae bacterium]
VSLAVDPTDNSIWAGSFGGGLVNIANKNIRIFKQHNSSLQNATVLGNTNNCNVSGLAFDQNKHLWISNYGAIKNLSVRKKDGSFQSFTIPFIHTENAVADILVDDANQIWILSPKGNGIFCFNYNNTIEVLSDDKWRLYQTGQNRGNLPSNNVHCFAKDKDGFIWVGTDRGIGIIDCAANVFTQNCDAILPIIQRSQFAGYLFQDENVQSIAVDGANRKWVGTKNGVWLISADGNTIIYRFSRENSPLLSNDVQKIVIHPTTGEVFFATTKGICSFRSTATEVASSSSNDVLVFPNPIPPDYNGTIAIRGIINNAWVKIVEPNGRLVFETKALGTQAVWNGRNYKGEKVASGVYLVLVKENNGNEKMVTKLVIVR